MRALCDPATILTGHAVGAISLQLHEGKRKRQRRVTAGARWHARGACPIRLHRLNFSRTGFSPETVIPHCGVKFFFAEIAELVQKFRDELWKWKSRQIQSENVIMSSLKVFGYFVEPCRHSDRPCSLLNFPTTSWAERVKAKMQHRQSQRTFLRHFWVPFKGFYLIETPVPPFFIEKLTWWFQFCLGKFCCDSKLVTSPLCNTHNSKKHSCRASFSQHKQMAMSAQKWTWAVVEMLRHKCNQVQ